MTWLIIALIATLLLGAALMWLILDSLSTPDPRAKLQRILQERRDAMSG